MKKLLLLCNKTSTKRPVAVETHEAPMSLYVVVVEQKIESVGILSMIADAKEVVVAQCNK